MKKHEKIFVKRQGLIFTLKIEGHTRNGDGMKKGNRDVKQAVRERKKKKRESDMKQTA